MDKNDITSLLLSDDDTNIQFAFDIIKNNNNNNSFIYFDINKLLKNNWALYETNFFKRSNGKHDWVLELINNKKETFQLIKPKKL